MADRETMEMRMMRAMAWERAKGELKSMLVTYNSGENYANKFEKMQTAIGELIEKVETDELQY